MSRLLFNYLAAGAPNGLRWEKARRLADAEGRGIPPTLTRPEILGRIRKDFRIAIPFWRRRLVPPGESRAARPTWTDPGGARRGSLSGWRVFYCLQIVAERK